ncbi:MAG: hypothetical protein Kow0069_16580 [Promethearchaeota archaeon]
MLPGQPEANVANVLRFVEEAKHAGADAVAFPEMCVGGYLVGDKWLDDEFCRDLASYDEDLAAASDGIAIVYGNIYLDDEVLFGARGLPGDWHPNQDGRPRRYNAIRVFQSGEPVPGWEGTPPSYHPACSPRRCCLPTGCSTTAATSSPRGMPPKTSRRPRLGAC